MARAPWSALGMLLLPVVAPRSVGALIARHVRPPDALGGALAFTVGSAAIVLGLRAAPLAWLAHRPQAFVAIVTGIGMALLSLELPAIPSHLAGSFGLILAGGTLGASVGARMQRSGHILAVALVSAGVDLWSVTSPHGTTLATVRNPALLRLLTVRGAVPSMP